MITFVKPTEEHLRYIKDNALDIDRKEAEVLHGVSLEEGIDLSMGSANESWVTLNNGVPACVFGVSGVGLLGNYGTIWMIATPELRNIMVSAVKKTRLILKYIMSKYSFIDNFILRENKKCVKWLTSVGFNIEPAQTLGNKNDIFYHLYMGVM